MTTTIKISMHNNSDARKLSIADVIAVPCKHNGGKVVIATVPVSRVEAVCALLDDDHSVKEYEVR